MRRFREGNTRSWDGKVTNSEDDAEAEERMCIFLPLAVVDLLNDVLI